MLSRTDPFIFLGPGCPTLYYPKLSTDQPAVLAHPLPKFIVPKSSIQPYAFIMPSKNRSPVIDSDSMPSSPGAPTGWTHHIGQGHVGRRTETEAERRASSVYEEEALLHQNSSSQPAFLNTGENFIFVEANQPRASFNLVGGEAGVEVGGAGDTYGGEDIEGKGAGQSGGTNLCFDDLDYNQNINWDAAQTFYPVTSDVALNPRVGVNVEYIEALKEDSFVGSSENLDRIVFEIVDEKEENATFKNFNFLGEEAVSGSSEYTNISGEQNPPVIVYEALDSYVVRDKVLEEKVAYLDAVTLKDSGSFGEVGSSAGVTIKNFCELKEAEVVQGGEMDNSKNIQNGKIVGEIVEEILGMIMLEV